jgi:hypothetical protein
MSYPPKNLVHVGGRWYPKDKAPKPEDAKPLKQSINEDRVKVIPKPAKPEKPETAKLTEAEKTEV